MLRKPFVVSTLEEAVRDAIAAQRDTHSASSTAGETPSGAATSR